MSRLGADSFRSARRALVAAGLAVAGFAGVAAPATAAGEVRITLRCEQAGDPADLRTCLAQSWLEVGRAGTIIRYQPEDLTALGDPSGGDLVLHVPKDFRVNAQNTGEDTRLSLSITAPSGRTVYDASAERYEWVQFTHCGPAVEADCRSYNYSEKGYGSDQRIRPRYAPLPDTPSE
ncbi:hypothetical protein [Roseospira navarrensis]|uniref:Uncharacterized protein n=1 Tax=Roseospira navarrensis TaxID=140058 RepID=A0A7X1ZHD8_9PROT|nr:hypothetical protein [Roseospira navarrensis]MQX38608.1 hypothetical protein [Roseospira navarrensis]